MHQEGILGTSRGNELLWTAPRQDDPHVREVFFGFAHFASYREDDLKARNMLVGFMGATGIRRNVIAEAFGVNRCLVVRYAKELQEGGADAIVRDRRGRKPKVTPEIEAFVRREFGKLYAKKRKNFVAKLISKVEKKFGVTLSSELVRQITKPVRDTLKNGDAEKKKPPLRGVPSESSPPASGEEFSTDEQALFDRLEEGFHSRYAGGLLLNAFLEAITEGVFEEENENE